jgi:hypothetical protein
MNGVTMLLWTALAAALLSGLMLGFLSNGAPEWATQATELVTVVTVFVLVCLAETAGSRSDKSSAQEGFDEVGWASDPSPTVSFVTAGKLTLALHVARDGRHCVIERRKVSSPYSGQPGIAGCMDDE